MALVYKSEYKSCVWY